MIHFDDNAVRDVLLEGRFGLERESLRLTEDGMLSQTKHPFPGDLAIVRDFCENQTEINTSVADSADEAVRLLLDHTVYIQKTLAAMEPSELLWPFSNPPYIRSEKDIPIARHDETAIYRKGYREYLADRYGRYKMSFSGIHVNCFRKTISLDSMRVFRTIKTVCT